MEVIIMTNGQNGLSGFERNGNLTCNCSWKQHSSCGPLNSWRPPFFGVPLKSKRGKAMRVVGVRVKALQKDESDNRLVGGGGVIEKELEFKPSFGEYLKAMESVKTGREKNQGKAFEKENIGSGVNKMNGGIVRNRSQADKITDKRYVQKNGLSRRSDQAMVRILKWKGLPSKALSNLMMLNGADIDMPEWMFSKAMRSARVKYTDHSVLRIIQILGKLGNWIEWLNIRERYKSHRLSHVYTTALHVLGKAKRPVEALNLFHAMQVLNACVRRKQWEGAFWVLQQMKEKDVQPSTATYGLVMEVMLACGKYNLVHEFFKKVQKSSIPNALVYKVLVNTFWREGKTEEAVLAVKDMERRGIVGSAALYYDLARCLCTSGRCQEALDLIEKICKVANKPLVVTYTGLIQACLDSGNIQNAVYIFNQMRNFCPPNLVTCNIMLKAYLEHGLFEEANELFNKMLDDGNHISRRSDYKFRVIPDIYTFNTMLDASIAENRWDDFEYVYQKMLRHGFHFNANRHLRMVLDASRAGK
ncbi:hypothetical protein D5086_003881, partial [Populus alba]